jgi:hypothetical protein
VVAQTLVSYWTNYLICLKVSGTVIENTMLRSVHRHLINARSRPLRLASVSLRSLHFNSKSFQPSAGFTAFSEELEKEVSDQILKIPQQGKVFQNADGSQRIPDDEELKQVAQLAYLANKNRYTVWDKLKLNDEQRALLAQNDYYLQEFAHEGKAILDKIPKEDPITGEITWEVVREGQKEGWEGLTYYGYVPALLLTLVFMLFLDKETPEEWAYEELKLRAQERYNEDLTSSTGKLSEEEIKKRDALMVERILSGDYDRLAGLKKAASDMPTSLI